MKIIMKKAKAITKKVKAMGDMQEVLYASM